MTACDRDGGITSVLLAYILASLSGVARWGGCAEDDDDEEEEDDDEEEEEDVRISTVQKW